MLIRIIKSGPGCAFRPGSLIRISDKRAKTLVESGYAVFEGVPYELPPEKESGYPLVGEDITSIIIPVHGQPGYTERCLSSVKRHTKDYEVILVDNGSDAQTRQVLRKSGYRIIRNSINRGFPAAVNQGILASRGKRICLLNNDTVVTPGWLEEMVGFLRDGVGFVGPTTNYSLGIQCDRSILKRDGFASSQRGLAPDYTDEEILSIGKRHKIRRGQKRYTNALSGFCLLIDRRVISEIGAFDERFGLGGSEEIDFEERANWRMVWACGAYVHHFGHQTLRYLAREKGINPSAWHNEELKERLSMARRRGASPVVPFFKNVPVMFPTWNRIEYTKRSLESLLETPDISICVYDDGSIDGTVEYLESINDPKIIAKVYREKRHGIDAQMDLFFSVVRGVDWIAKVDNDTIMPKGWLESLIEAASRCSLDVVGSDHHTSGRKRFFSRPVSKNGRVYYSWSHVGGSGILIRGKWLDSALRKNMTVWHPKFDLVPGGWTYFQERNVGEKGFVKEVFARTLDTLDDYTRVEDYPEYNRRMKAERERCYQRPVGI